jgi:hypothetical protein
MANIFGTYWLTHSDPAAGSTGFYTTGLFPRGVNVFVNAALSHVRTNPRAVVSGFECNQFAFIDSWSVYGTDGSILPGTGSLHNPFQSSVYINNCANITFGVLASGAEGAGQFTIFSL